MLIVSGIYQMLAQDGYRRKPYFMEANAEVIAHFDTVLNI